MLLRNFLLSALILSPFAISAQSTDYLATVNEGTLPAVWSLDDCLQYAEAHNIQLLQKQIAVEDADQQIIANEGALFPSLSFATNQNVSWRPWSQSFTDLNNGTLTTSSSDVNYNGTYGLTAQWTVWDGGKNRMNLKRSKVSRNQTVYDSEMTLDNIRQQIAQIYVQILYQTDAVAVNQRILESTKVLCDRAQEMFDVGSLSRAELVQMKAQVSQDEYNVVNAKTTLDNYKL